GARADSGGNAPFDPRTRWTRSGSRQIRCCRRTHQPLPGDRTSMNTLLQDWPDLSQEERREAFERVPREQAQKFFLELSSHDQLDLLLSLPPGERRLWLRLLAPDDAADVIQLAPREERQELTA